MKMKQLELERKEGAIKTTNLSFLKSETHEITTEIIESIPKTRISRTTSGKGLTLKKY